MKELFSIAFRFGWLKTDLGLEEYYKLEFRRY